ncbi:unnamed protein product, partial [Pylaiella littoralis]
ATAKAGHGREQSTCLCMMWCVASSCSTAAARMLENVQVWAIDCLGDIPSPATITSAQD